MGGVNKYSSLEEEAIATTEETIETKVEESTEEKTNG